eukprot:jgi/Chlat1/9271/Chrsp99S09297
MESSTAPSGVKGGESAVPKDLYQQESALLELLHQGRLNGSLSDQALVTACKYFLHHGHSRHLLDAAISTQLLRFEQRR